MPAEIKKDILVVGGGISGLTAAIEASEVGYDVLIVEKNPYLGGMVTQYNKYFPKLCPPTCGLEINLRRIKFNPKIAFYTLAEVEEISGSPGNYSVSIKINPRYINDRCVGCDACAQVCPVEVPNEFNYGFDKRKAVYLPHERALPFLYVIDGAACKKPECKKCVDACKYGAINLDMKPETVKVEAGAIVLATGFRPYDAARIDNLGFGTSTNIITNVMMERLASPNGPTKGKILRPSDGKEIKTIAFAQCAGSRDENHLPYCSAICCLASLKQATYVREQYPDSKVYIFYIDLRSFGTAYERFFNKIQADKNVFLIKGKVGRVAEEPITKEIIVEAEDTATGRKTKISVDLCVLAVGMVPTGPELKLPPEVKLNEYGFVVGDGDGIFAIGCLKNPTPVSEAAREATGAVLKAISVLKRRG